MKTLLPGLPPMHNQWGEKGKLQSKKHLIQIRARWTESTILRAAEASMRGAHEWCSKLSQHVPYCEALDAWTSRGDDPSPIFSSETACQAGLLGFKDLNSVCEYFQNCITRITVIEEDWERREGDRTEEERNEASGLEQFRQEITRQSENYFINPKKRAEYCPPELDFLPQHKMCDKRCKFIVLLCSPFFETPETINIFFWYQFSSPIRNLYLTKSLNSIYTAPKA